MRRQDPSNADAMLQQSCGDTNAGFAGEAFTFLNLITINYLIGKCIEEGVPYVQLPGLHFQPYDTINKTFHPFRAPFSPTCYGPVQQCLPGDCGLSALLSLAGPFAANGGFLIPSQGWPTTNFANPATVNYDHYQYKEPTKLGGVELDVYAPYSLLGGCPAALPLFPNVLLSQGPRSAWPPPGASQTRLKGVTVITDGTCGSSCSVFLTSPYLDGLVTAVSYGGFHDEPNDITSFHGGPVREWAAVWPGLLAIADVLNTFRDALAPLNPQVAAVKKLDTLKLIPMPGRASVDLIMSAVIMANQLGPNSLPVEWYRLPPAHHLNMWISKEQVTPQKLVLSGSDWPWCQLMHLYQEVDKLEAKPLKCEWSDYKYDNDWNTVTSTAFGIAIAALIVALSAAAIALKSAGSPKSNASGGPTYSASTVSASAADRT